MKFTIFSPYKCYISILVKIGSTVLEKILTARPQQWVIQVTLKTALFKVSEGVMPA